jgi:hypothetical protein
MYLAAGMQFRNVAYSFRISEIPVAVVVVKSFKAVWRKLQKLHVSETNVVVVPENRRRFTWQL